ncbi:MAG: N-acetyltransferase [Ignavibacterium sp.]|nr:N-acetyltransferase [Ignavibacterium sp.]MCX7611870.1 N-acetyltransferase [Ignavibacterium sp.]MDW8374900.1 GNAT family N-acetyltransferase [Ignavibacteriales bacterium]
MEVIHNSKEKSFLIQIENDIAYVSYNLNNEVMDLYTTYTPPQLRGKGLAEKVVRAALEYAKSNNLKIIPSCSYVKVFLERHPEYKSLVK